MSQQLITIETLKDEQSLKEQQLSALLQDLGCFITEQKNPVSHLSALHTLIQNQIFHLKLKMLTGRGSYHIWIKREENLGENWTTITIEV